MVTVKSVLQYLPGAAFWKWGVQLGRSVPASDQTRMQRTSRGWVPFQTSKEHLCPQPSPTSLHPLHVPQSRTITLLPCVLPTVRELLWKFPFKMLSRCFCHHFWTNKFRNIHILSSCFSFLSLAAVCCTASEQRGGILSVLFSCSSQYLNFSFSFVQLSKRKGQWEV